MAGKQDIKFGGKARYNYGGKVSIQKVQNQSLEAVLFAALYHSLEAVVLQEPPLINALTGTVALQQPIL